MPLVLPTERSALSLLYNWF